MYFKNEHLINRQYNFDLEIFKSGYQQSISNYFFGPAVRSHYLIHYVISGSGSVLLNNKLYEVTAGQAFIIFPNEVSFYQADENFPFEYTWIGFNGLKSDLFFQELNMTANSNPIIIFDKEPLCFKELREINEICVYDEVKLLGLLYLMFYDLLKLNKDISINKDEPAKIQLSYADKTLDFINKNYYKKLSVDYIARYIGLNKSYSGIVLVIFGESFVKLFIDNPTPSILAYARETLNWSAVFFIPLGLIFIYRNVLQGIGDSFIPLIGGIYELLARAVVAFTLPKFIGFTGICLSDPAAWLAAAIPLGYAYYKRINKLLHENI